MIPPQPISENCELPKSRAQYLSNMNTIASKYCNKMSHVWNVQQAKSLNWRLTSIKLVAVSIKFVDVNLHVHFCIYISMVIDHFNSCTAILEQVEVPSCSFYSPLCPASFDIFLIRQNYFVMQKKFKWFVREECSDKNEKMSDLLILLLSPCQFSCMLLFRLQIMHVKCNTNIKRLWYSFLSYVKEEASLTNGHKCLLAIPWSLLQA